MWRSCRWRRLAQTGGGDAGGSGTVLHQGGGAGGVRGGGGGATSENPGSGKGSLRFSTIFPGPDIKLSSLQESCIIQLYPELEEDSSYHSCEELLLNIPPLFPSLFRDPGVEIMTS